MPVDVMTQEQAGPVTCKLASDVGSLPSTAESCGESSSRDDGSGASQLCKRCVHLLSPATKQGGGELNPTAYLSIVHRLQEKVHVLQEALLTSNKCAFLLDSLGRPGDPSTTEVPLQQPRNFGEGNVTRRMRNEWAQAVEANNTITSLRHVSSQIDAEKFDGWMSEVPLNCWNNRDVSQMDSVYINTWEEASKEKVTTSLFHAKQERVGGAANTSASPCVAVDPVILVDITAVLHKGEPRPPAAMCGEDFSRVEMDAGGKHLAAENVRLHGEVAEMQRALEVRDEEVRRQKVELAGLNQTVKRLQECNKALQESFEALQHRCDDATKMTCATELRSKGLIATIASLEVESKQKSTDCAAARREAEDAWQEVRRLESALRAWEVKGRELQRLRLLMRFSELKKDSDRLSVVEDEMESAENERDRLREENERFRELLSEYRKKMEIAVTNTAEPEPLTPALEYPPTRNCEVPPKSQAPQATVPRPNTADEMREPQRPPVASDATGKKRKMFVPHPGRRHSSLRRWRLGLSSSCSGSRNCQEFFGCRGDGACHPQAVRK
ncbi:hypothetical protein TraAM80_02930 [Trypanosoma rangeli]|uniref:Uncharacterized protein n=1 Tax=Trypanosoma rangeli TaxID=5698 RepID=A0A3R7M3G7_TRYRA|nr:uncharacterized protein TraAM80_02930 [Trypanosoma rangeli]RNF08340.1 hypothetical protein TraAM80_02930 [Trypanosoma rangeli]|eukprot:RNF08340.1 hypothetical protein TraAM80_02930 [Trypanosoma rangeli]